MTNEELRARLDAHEQRIAKLELLFKSSPEAVPSKPLSIKEFLLEKTPKGDVQRTLSICYFLEKYEKAESFNVKDIEAAFRKAKTPLPGNINDMIYQNIQKGFIMEASEKKEGKKAWTLTSSGETEVESNFGKK
jgi:hypothetical protein